MYLWCIINKNPELWCKSVSAFKAIIISSISSVDIHNELISTDNFSSRYTSHHRVHLLNTALRKTWFIALHFINRLLQRHCLLTYLLNISILQSVCKHENEIWRQSKLVNTRHLNLIYQRLYWKLRHFLDINLRTRPYKVNVLNIIKICNTGKCSFRRLFT